MIWPAAVQWVRAFKLYEPKESVNVHAHQWSAWYLVPHEVLTMRSHINERECMRCGLKQQASITRGDDKVPCDVPAWLKE